MLDRRGGEEMDEEINEKIKKTLTEQIELLSKKSADEVDSHKVYELSKAMCQVAELLLDYLDI